MSHAVAIRYNSMSIVVRTAPLKIQDTLYQAMINFIQPFSVNPHSLLGTIFDSQPFVSGFHSSLDAPYSPLMTKR